MHGVYTRAAYPVGSVWQGAFILQDGPVDHPATYSGATSHENASTTRGACQAPVRITLANRARCGSPVVS